MILAIDLGTTNWKAALITHEGRIAQLVRIPTPVMQEDGCPCYEAAAVGDHLAGLLQQCPPGDRSRIDLIALTGMAEAGLIVDRDTLSPLSNVWPWFDRRALPVYEETRADPRFAGRHERTGLPDSYKYGIYKLLTLLGTGRYDKSRVKWMGLVAYAASLFTGQCCEDVSIAARTDCVDLRRGCWDEPFLQSIGLDSGMFPALIPQGGLAGTLREDLYGIRAGTPVCIGGHDHVCASYASGALQQGGVFLSTGTAQVVLGPAHAPETASGLSYGPSPCFAPYTCLGSIQSAGGSVNFWKERLYPGEDFATLLREVQAAPVPSGLLYHPYLAGSGAPHLDPNACGTLIGLRDTTSRAGIIAAVYEGIAMETRYLVETMGAQTGMLYCMGGLTRHTRYMQTLADVLSMTVCVPDMDEGTLYGAARLALDRLGRSALPPLAAARSHAPDTDAHARWNSIFRQLYLPMMNHTKAEVMNLWNSSKQ